MNYSEFKGELYKMVAERCAVSGRGVWLLEEEDADQGAEFLRSTGLCAGDAYGSSRSFAGEDTLCIFGNGREQIRMLHWSMRSLYGRFEREGWQSVLPEILSKLYGAGEGDRMILRPYNYHCHREELRNGIYWSFGDIALVLHTLIFEGREDCVSMKYSRAMAEKRNLPDEILLTNALLCSSALMPPKLYYCEDGQSGEGGYRLTTAGGTAGAVSLFYPGIKERLAECLGGDYYVGFPSAREVVIHPVHKRGLGGLKSFILCENAVRDRRECLTDRIYRYSSTHQRLIEV